MHISQRKRKVEAVAGVPERNERPGVTVLLARAVRLAGVSRSATAGLQRKLKTR